MNWEYPPQQDLGSKDCFYFSAAYIIRALGIHTTWQEVKEWYIEKPRFVSTFIPIKTKATPLFTVWGDSNEECIQNHRLAHSNVNKDFKSWVKLYIDKGCIGSAHYHTLKDIGHAVPILDCSDIGVYLADSCHGLIWVDWDKFLNPFTEHERAWIDSWYLISK